MTKSMEAGRPVAVENKSTIAEGLAVLLVGYNTFATCKDCVDKMVCNLTIQKMTQIVIYLL